MFHQWLNPQLYINEQLENRLRELKTKAQKSNIHFERVLKGKNKKNR